MQFLCHHLRHEWQIIFLNHTIRPRKPWIILLPQMTMKALARKSRGRFKTEGSGSCSRTLSARLKLMFVPYHKISFLLLSSNQELFSLPNQNQIIHSRKSLLRDNKRKIRFFFRLVSGDEDMFDTLGVSEASNDIEPSAEAMKEDSPS